MHLDHALDVVMCFPKRKNKPRELNNPWWIYTIETKRIIVSIDLTLNLENKEAYTVV